MSQRMVITLIPVDQTGLPEIPGVGRPEPSIEHTLTTCQQCGRDCWIGPKQLDYFNKNGGEKLCYFCMFAAMATQMNVTHVVALNRHADDVPRRT